MTDNPAENPTAKPTNAAPAPRHFLQLADFSASELRGFLALGARLKRGESFRDALRGRTIALFFSAPSTRTRLSFAAGAAQLGAVPVVLSPTDLHLGRGESLADTARGLSCYADAIVLRMPDETSFTTFAEAARVPVINGLTERVHPCQLLADLMTLESCFPSPLPERVVAWSGAFNNMTRSWMQAAERLGFRLRLSCPLGADAMAAEDTASLARANGLISLHDTPSGAVSGADVVVTDCWSSLGEDESASARAARATALAPYQVDSALMAQATPQAIFMHCLPAHRGEEVSGTVLDGTQSRVWEEAANRLWAQQAVLLWSLGLESV